MCEERGNEKEVRVRGTHLLFACFWSSVVEELEYDPGMRGKSNQSHVHLNMKHVPSDRIVVDCNVEEDPRVDHGHGETEQNRQWQNKRLRQGRCNRLPRGT